MEEKTQVFGTLQDSQSLPWPDSRTTEDGKLCQAGDSEPLSHGSPNKAISIRQMGSRRWPELPAAMVL